MSRPRAVCWSRDGDRAADHLVGELRVAHLFERLRRGHEWELSRPLTTERFASKVERPDVVKESRPFTISTLCQGEGSKDGKVEEAVMQLERDWCNVTLKSDADWLTRVLADDASFVTSMGQRQTKAQVVADFKAEKTKTCQVDQMQVRAYGDTAVVTGRWRITGTDAKGKPFPTPESMFTDTFVRLNGQWQCVASHSSAVTK